MIIIKNLFTGIFMKSLFLKTSIILFFIFFLVGCQEKRKNEHINNNQLVYASTKDIRNINPHLYAGEMSAQNMVFESLVINTKDGIKPNLAKKWEISNDNKKYTFYLRTDVFFSDGTIFDANIAKKNIDAVLSNRERHAWLELVNEIDTTKVIAPYILEITLKNPYYPTLIEFAMTRPFRFISSKCFINNETKDGVSCYSGTGPWILKEHKKNAYAVFVKNPKYWGEKPKLDEVKFRVIPDHQAILLALEKNEVDLIFGADGDMIDLNVFSMLEKENKYATLLSDPVASRAILLNTKQPITKDLKVREALQYAINKQAIVKGILNDSESIAHSLFAPTTAYCDIALDKKEFNPIKAKKILDDDGWKLSNNELIRTKNNKKLILRLYFNANNAQEKTISEYIQSNLKDIGIDLKIIGEEKQSFLDRQKSGDFDLQYSLSWGVPYDPQSYISSWRMAAHGDYQAQLGLSKKAWLDKQIKAVLIEPDKTTREKMYKQLLEYIHKESVYIPLSYSRTKAVFNTKVKGVTFNLSQYEIPFEKMYIDNKK
jgi:nickel transport system substrate-binding protein